MMVAVSGEIIMWSGEPAATSKLLLVPDLSAPVVVMATPVCTPVMVTLPVQTPLVKLPVELGVMVLVVSLKVFVPV
ncbi:hypothetical protein ES703_39014 [subsurface metagenome]